MPKSRTTVNQHPFRCAGCGHWYPCGDTRIAKKLGEWICARCANGPPLRANVSSLAPDDINTCRTCGRTIEPGRRTVNNFGKVVHLGGCPTANKRTVGARHGRRRRPRSSPS